MKRQPPYQLTNKLRDQMLHTSVSRLLSIKPFDYINDLINKQMVDSINIELDDQMYDALFGLREMFNCLPRKMK